MMDLRTYLVLQLLGCCFCYVAAICVSQNCTISNCTQNPRSGIDEDVFYCSISNREGCAKLKEKFQDQRVSSSEESPPLLMRLALYVHEQYAALNLTFLIHSGLGKDLPANEGVTLEFWSNDDPEYNNTCHAFNFSPQRVTPAIPARDITYCSITGLYPGTEQKQETPYFLKLTAFPSKSSITYHLLYQGWTFEEVARLQCKGHAVWKPMIAIARRSSNGNIHVVVESPPQEFNVQEIEFAVFCGKRTKKEMVPLKSFVRAIFKDDSYHVVTEFKDLPPEQCAVKVTPKCRDAGKCNESWSDWLGMNTVTEKPSPHPAVIAVPVLVGVLLVIGIAGIVWYWRQRSINDNPAPRKSIFVISLSNSREESQTTKITKITEAFAEYLCILGFEATMLRADEMKNEQILQDHLDNADVIVLLCIPGRSMVARDELFCLLELDEKLRKKSILGCLHTGSQERQSCQHSLDCRAMEDERREEAMNGSQERLLSSSFPQLTEELQNCCCPLAEMEEKEFTKFYWAIRCKAGLQTQPDAGCADGDSWEYFRQRVGGLTEPPDPSDDSSASSSVGEPSDDEDNSESELDKTSASGTEDSSSVDDQCGPEHNTPGNTHHAAENGSFSGNNHLSRAQDGYLRPEIQRVPHYERTDYPAGSQIHMFHNHALTSQYPRHYASHSCSLAGMHQDHRHCSPRFHHCSQRNGHLEPEVHRPFACLGNQVVSGGNSHSCHCQFPFHQNQALCAHQRSSNGYPCSTNIMLGHHQAGMGPTYPEPCQRYPPH